MWLLDYDGALLMRLPVYYSPYESGIVHIQFYALWWHDDMRLFFCCATRNVGVAHHAGEKTPMSVGDTHFYVISM